MKCTNCGNELEAGVSFCTNCGTPVAKAADVAQAAGVGALGASLESAVEANKGVVDSFEAHSEIADQAAARWAEAEAEAAYDAAPEPPVYEAPATQEYVAPSYGKPEAPAGYQAAAAGGVPFYQQDASPNAHYSSQRTYEQNAYGQDTGQPAYQQPSYDAYGGQDQAQTAAPQQVWEAQSATKRAFAMTLYVAGLFGVIFGLTVRDKDDAFITHHLNNCVVLLIGSVIASVLSAFLIGFVALIYLFVMLIMGIVSAYNGDMKELPLIGKIHIIS